uniref:Uncharacterized protein n=1 Tax=Quercus lobata TaxID=97700 RepID=A0A7N2N158_QUELO
MRPSSSLVTTASSNSSVEYIQRLENKIIELKEARVRDQEERVKDQKERARDQEARAKQEEVQKNILNFLRSKGCSYLWGWFNFKLNHYLGIYFWHYLKTYEDIFR